MNFFNTCNMESIQYYKAVLAPRVLEEQNWKNKLALFNHDEI